MQAGADYLYTDAPQVHFQRRKEILREHPEARELNGPHVITPISIVLVVAGHFTLAWLFRDLPIWAVAVLAYVVGAVFSHALYVLIHECTHNLAFKRPWANKVMGIFCDFPLTIPSAMSFRKYHMIHHKFLGELEMDPDLVVGREARWVGNSRFKKAVWLVFFSISQALRPVRNKNVKMWDGWTWANTILQFFVIDVAIFFLLGPAALLYLFLSTFFALGLHPLGGRWIQEHYVTKPGQETYSYYGLGNVVAFNIGYHNEHHDFMNVPWFRLPRLTKMSPRHYASLKSYRSWTGVLLRFIFDPKMSSYSRIVHPSTLGRTKPARTAV
jgi:sphingolipid delta-4 desaturase